MYYDSYAQVTVKLIKEGHPIQVKNSKKTSEKASFLCI